MQQKKNCINNEITVMLRCYLNIVVKNEITITGYIDSGCLPALHAYYRVDFAQEGQAE